MSSKEGAGDEAADVGEVRDAALRAPRAPRGLPMIPAIMN